MFNKSHFSLKKIALLLIFILFLVSCKEEIKPLTFDISSVDRKFEADIEVSYDVAKANSDIAKTLNKNTTSAILKSIPNSKNNTSIEEALTAFDEDYKTFKKEFSDSEQTWSLAVETELLYKTETIITMGLSVYADTGGAHGSDTIQLLNFNPETGNLYSNEDLFSDIEGFKKIAKTYFLDHMKNEGSDISEFFFGKDFQLPENIGFNDEGIILLYNVYEIASYNQGYTEFVIPIEKVIKYLKIS
jgi:hypothetical protein